jgi:hypothetical protein
MSEALSIFLHLLKTGTAVRRRAARDPKSSGSEPAENGDKFQISNSKFRISNFI